MKGDPDFLDEFIAERTALNPDFPRLVEAAARRRALLKELGGLREKGGRSQTAVAAEMKTSQSSVARLEGSADDARLSTLDRYTVGGGDIVVHDAPALPAFKDQCKNGGWKTFAVFKNQGDCVSFVATGGKNPPAKKPPA